MFSLIPFRAEPISQGIIAADASIPSLAAAPYATPSITNPADETIINLSPDKTVAEPNSSAAQENSDARPLSGYETRLMLGSYLWIFGVAAMLLYAVISYIRLKRRVSLAVRTDGNVFETDRIDSPFVLGLFRPRIYLPIGMVAAQSAYIIEHERTHIKRRDYIVSVVAFVALALHWFNPLVWMAYLLMLRDMESSCDEAVLRNSSKDIRCEYSFALLGFSRNKARIPLPIAFGEQSIKSRVKNVLNFKKPSRVIIAVALVVVVVLSVGCALKRAADSGNQSPSSSTSDDADKTTTPVPSEQTLTDIELAFANYKRITDMMSPENTNAFDLTIRDLQMEDGETELRESAGDANYKLIVDGNNCTILNIYNEASGKTTSYAFKSLASYSFEVHEGDEIVRAQLNTGSFIIDYERGEPTRYELLNLDMGEIGEEFAMSYAGGVEKPSAFSDVVNMTFAKTLSAVKWSTGMDDAFGYGFDIASIRSAEIVESDGFTTTTLIVDPLGIAAYRATSDRNAPADYDDYTYPRMNTDYGDSVVYTIVTDRNGIPVSCSHQVETMMTWLPLGDWGEGMERPPTTHYVQRTETTFNAWSSDVEITFEPQPLGENAKTVTPPDPAQVEAWRNSRPEPSYIPEGFAEIDCNAVNTSTAITYANESGETISFISMNTQFDFRGYSVPDEVDYQIVQIGDVEYHALNMADTSDPNRVMWNSNDLGFQVYSQLPLEELYNIAVSVG